jgi:hypothetical protein
MSTSASPTKSSKSAKSKTKPTPKVPHPPIALSAESWARRTQSAAYIKRIKRMAQNASTYRLLVHGDTRSLSRQQRNALHYFADTNEMTNERRDRSSSRLGGSDTGSSTVPVHTDKGGFGDNTPPKDSVRY